MDLNSRLFDKIRIKKPSCDEPKAATQGQCETPGCQNPGLYRAPKGRKAEGQYWRFCMDHVRAYNATYNYFDGMNDAAVQAYQKDAIIGHRPTWAMGMNGSAGARDPNKTATERDWAYVDPLGILRAEGVGAKRARGAEPEPKRPRHTAAARKALDVMGLDEGADAAAIKAQYKALVKRFHPDANGGDRSFEERLRDIIRAHDTLRAAGLC
ncbi:J domain-containing protein [Methylobacterium sp. sgz302541]|uniref:J domain-containing protein n=1 Tax=unclassified Methylobacterium TaxID=2615210 RepID=UPI003D3399FF